MTQLNQNVDERTRQLVRIIDQLETFIAEQLEQWDQVVAHADEAAAMHARANRMLKEVESEKANWDRERGERIAKLQDESRMLEEAWKRIETEDRRLAAKEAIQDRTYSKVAPISTAQVVQPEVERSETDRDIDDSKERNAAVQEFRKLSVEIANHAKRTR